MYGNVILVREGDGNLSEDQYTKFLKSDVPPQKLSIDIKENASCINALVKDLADGDIEMSSCHEAAKETDFEALRKFGLIYARDLATGDVTPITQTIDKYVNEKQKQRIKENFPIEKTNEDITLSYDQAENLHDAIVRGMTYPKLTGENDEVDFDELVDFMWKLRSLFKWDIYEKKTIGKRGTDDEKSVIKWYCTILLRWIRGNGLNTIVRSAVRYKENNPWTGVWSGDYMVEETYNPKSKYHKNLVIAESLSVIENVLLFSISNYFRKFSMEYKAVHQVENFENDWYEYVEYGTTNPLTILFTNTNSVISDSKVDTCHAIFQDSLFHCQLSFHSSIRVFYRIAQQIDEHLTDTQSISIKPAVGQLNIRFKNLPLFCEFSIQHRMQFIQKIGQIKIVLHQRHFVAFNLRHIQNIIQQSQQII